MACVEIVTEHSSTEEKATKMAHVEIKIEMPIAVVKKAKSVSQIATDFAKSVWQFLKNNSGNILATLLVVGIFGYIIALLVCMSVCIDAAMPLLISFIVLIAVALICVPLIAAMTRA